MRDLGGPRPAAAVGRVPCGPPRGAPERRHDGRAASPPRAPRLGRRLGTQLLVGLLLLGPVVGGLGFRISAGQHAHASEAAFGDALSARVHDVDRELRSAADVLRSCRALYEASEQVTRREFETFTHDASTRHRSIAAIAWAPRVAAIARGAYARAARDEGVATRGIVVRGAHGAWPTAPAAETHYPVHFIEPAATHAEVLGFDVATDPVRRAALWASLATGDVVASDPVAMLANPTERCISLIVPAFDHRQRTPSGQDAPLGVLMLCLRLDAVGASAQVRSHGDDAPLRLTWSDASVAGRAERLHPRAP